MNLKDITDTAKTALDIANELKNIELKEAILDLKEKLIELREENIELKEQLKEKQEYNMVFEDNAYWNVKENGKYEGPYCSVCWDCKKIPIRLSQNTNTDFYKCGQCKNEVCVHNIHQYM